MFTFLFTPQPQYSEQCQKSSRYLINKYLDKGTNVLCKKIIQRKSKNKNKLGALSISYPSNSPILSKYSSAWLSQRQRNMFTTLFSHPGLPFPPSLAVGSVGLSSGQRSSTSNVHTNHPAFLLSCRYEFSRSGACNCAFLTSSQMRICFYSLDHALKPLLHQALKTCVLQKQGHPISNAYT